MLIAHQMWRRRSVVLRKAPLSVRWRRRAAMKARRGGRCVGNNCNEAESQLALSSGGAPKGRKERNKHDAR